MLTENKIALWLKDEYLDFSLQVKCFSQTFLSCDYFLYKKKGHFLLVPLRDNSYCTERRTFALHAENLGLISDSLMVPKPEGVISQCRVNP